MERLFSNETVRPVGVELKHEESVGMKQTITSEIEKTVLVKRLSLTTCPLGKLSPIQLNWNERY